MSEQALEVVSEQLPVVRSSHLSVEELHSRLSFVRQIMRQEMKEGQDYGKIPGTGDKPSLLQPGAQKLLMTFNLREQVKKETMRELPHSIYGHREYEITLTVFPAGLTPEQGWDGVGTCTTLESKYRYRKGERVCPNCGKAAIIAENPAYVKAPDVPGFLCWKKKGGCGVKFRHDAPEILNQSTDKQENENPADTWNTVRKMAFKRALVAAAINATNTSELWTQDVEDSVEAVSVPLQQAGPEEPPREAFETLKTAPEAKSAPQKAAPDMIKTRIRALNLLQATPGQPNRALVSQFLVAQKWIRGDQTPEDWDLRYVPTSKADMTELSQQIAMFERQQTTQNDDSLPFEP